MTQISDKIILITGATNGIGEAAARAIAQTGAQVIIVGRSQDKCHTTTETIKRDTGNPNVRYYVADLSLQSEVRQLVAQLNADLPRLDVLLNNAGAWFTERETTTEGFEKTWALNHLSYFLLTHGLLDLLKQTAAAHGEARIINQSAIAHHEGEMHWDNLQFEGNWEREGGGTIGPGWAVYSQSKLANVLHAFALARRLDGTEVVANAVHPSVVVTGFAQNNGWIYKLATPVRRLFNRTSAHEGAQPAVYLATSPEAAKINGAYYGPPHKREDVKPLANDMDVQDRLWSVSAEQVGTVST